MRYQKPQRQFLFFVLRQGLETTVAIQALIRDPDYRTATDYLIKVGRIVDRSVAGRRLFGNGCVSG